MESLLTYQRGEDVQLTPNFALREMECQCGKCPETRVYLPHMDNLQALRDTLKAPIIITSGYRCAAHNANIGGHPRSKHMIGKATDIIVAHMTADNVADECEHFDGLGRYNTFTHVDSRGKPARWDLR